MTETTPSVRVRAAGRSTTLVSSRAHQAICDLVLRRLHVRASSSLLIDRGLEGGGDDQRPARAVRSDARGGLLPSGVTLRALGARCWGLQADLRAWRRAAQVDVERMSGARCSARRCSISYAARGRLRPSSVRDARRSTIVAARPRATPGRRWRSALCASLPRRRHRASCVRDELGLARPDPRWSAGGVAGEHRCCPDRLAYAGASARPDSGRAATRAPARARPRAASSAARRSPSWPSRRP